MEVAVVSIVFMCQKRHVTESYYYTRKAKNKISLHYEQDNQLFKN